MSDVTDNRFYREAPADERATDYEKAYFERGMFAAYAWMITRKRGEELSDAVVEHAWANRDAGMGPTECLPTRPDRFANDEAARAIYDTWFDQPGWVPWVERGNSLMQERARREVAL